MAVVGVNHIGPHSGNVPPQRPHGPDAARMAGEWQRGQLLVGRSTVKSSALAAGNFNLMAAVR